jgi:hypothetical protein
VTVIRSARVISVESAEKGFLIRLSYPWLSTRATMNTKEDIMRIFISIAMIVMIAFPAFSDVEIRAGAGTSVTFVELPDFDGVVRAMASPGAKMYYGVGWEVIFDRIGVGGNYFVDFDRDANKVWSVEWLTEALYVSYHLFGAGSFFDLFGNAGIGCSGSIRLDNSYYSADMIISDGLLISLYPFFDTGIAFNLGGVVVGAKVGYVPWMSPPPVSPIDQYPMNNFNVSIFIQASFMARRDTCSEGCE